MTKQQAIDYINATADDESAFVVLDVGHLIDNRKQELASVGVTSEWRLGICRSAVARQIQYEAGHDDITCHMHKRMREISDSLIDTFIRTEREQLTTENEA